MKNYKELSRKDWKIACDVSTDVKFDKEISGINSDLMDEAKDIYAPLLKVLATFVPKYQEWQNEKADFLGLRRIRTPFIVGITGSVAVGKSTAAHLLTNLFNQLLPQYKTEMITTDDFLAPNKELEEKGIMNRKGFPESFNTEKMLDFLKNIINGEENVKAPVYSHETYDIVPGASDIIEAPDVLIVEGVNVDRITSEQEDMIGNYLNFSIYLDADTDLIESWYLDRFNALTDAAKDHPENYYYKYAQMNREEAINQAKQVWKEINLPNLEENILPKKDYANLVLHKDTGHRVDKVYWEEV